MKEFPESINFYYSPIIRQTVYCGRMQFDSIIVLTKGSFIKNYVRRKYTKQS